MEAVANEIDVIAGLYTFREADEVRVFLKRNPFAFDILERTRPEIMRIFGAHALNVFLEVHYDIEEREESLWIKIQLDLGIDSAEEHLQRFDRECWVKNRNPFFWSLGADVEFAPSVQA